MVDILVVVGLVLVLIVDISILVGNALLLVGIVVEVVWVLLGFVRLGNVGIVLVYVVV